MSQLLNETTRLANINKYCRYYNSTVLYSRDITGEMSFKWGQKGEEYNVKNKISFK